MAFIPGFVLMLLEHDERRNYMRLHKRHLRDTQNPFEMPDESFRYMFRLTKDIVQHVIETLNPHVNDRRRVLITLNFLSRGCYQYSVGSSSWTSTSQPSVSRAVTQICRLIAEHMMPEWIKFPTTPDSQSHVKEGFYDTYGLRGVIGAIDGTHVNIVSPPTTDEDHPPHVYINRKGNHSVNVMLICDANNKILACNARYPGSVHDSAIYRMSDVRPYFVNNYENGNHVGHLIGDSGYPLEPWLFTPYQAVEEGTPQANFNHMLRSARNVIERTNGILKGRFRCLLQHRVLHYRPDKAAFIIYAACVLHNMAVEVNIILDENEEVYDENHEDNNGYNNELAVNDNFVHLGRIAREEYVRRNL